MRIAPGKKAKFLRRRARRQSSAVADIVVDVLEHAWRRPELFSIGSRAKVRRNARD